MYKKNLNIATSYEFSKTVDCSVCERMCMPMIEDLQYYVDSYAVAIAIKTSIYNIATLISRKACSP